MTDDRHKLSSVTTKPIVGREAEGSKSRRRSPLQRLLQSLRTRPLLLLAWMVELPRSAQLAISCAGIFLSFSYFAVLQEDVYKKAYGGEYFKYTFLALVAERGINAAIGGLGILCFGSSGLVIPHREIFMSGCSQMFAMAGSNEALRYVSYPTQVLGKSCKMVPVMAGGIILGGKSYSLIEYFQVALITAGVCLFNLLGKKKKGGNDSLLGLGLIFFSLIMDMVTGGLQDKVKKSTKELNPDAGEKPVPLPSTLPVISSNGPPRTSDCV